MLKPEYLEALPEAVILFMDELEEWVIADIVKQLMEAGAGESTIAKVRALLAVYDETELRKHIETAAKKAEVTAGELLQQAITKDFDAQRRAYAAAGKQAKLDPLRDLLKNAGDKLQGEMLNLTGTTMGFSVKQNGKTVFQPLGEYYTNVLNRAQMEVSLGISDHQTAVRRAVKEMANSGLRQVDYESGRSVRLESAVRTAVLTGVNQASTAMTDALMTELGAEYVEVTAHSGARPDHAEWQGKVYHISELAAKTGYGTVGGLKGANCRHDYYPFFPGISERAYTDEELKHIDPPPFTFEGKEYTAYEATQMQRRYERNIRSVRDQLAGYDASEDKESFTAYSVRLKRLEQGYREFSNAAGLHTRSDRLQMVGFGRSTSAKAVWANKKQQNKWFESIEKSAQSGKIKLPDVVFFKSVGAKAGNYDVVDPETGDILHFAEGSKLQNASVFAGKGTKKRLHDGVAEGLSEQLGGRPENWQHCKGDGVIDYYGKDRPAEVHWFQEETVGKVKFKVKRWKDES